MNTQKLIFVRNGSLYWCTLPFLTSLDLSSWKILNADRPVQWSYLILRKTILKNLLRRAKTLKFLPQETWRAVCLSFQGTDMCILFALLPLPKTQECSPTCSVRKRWMIFSSLSWKWKPKLTPKVQARSRLSLSEDGASRKNDFFIIWQYHKW